jgi:hypothetical protein
VIPPADQRIALERELAFAEEEIERLQALAERLDAAPRPQAFRSTVELGLRLNSVMREWLTEQLAAAE